MLDEGKEWSGNTKMTGSDRWLKLKTGCLDLAVVVEWLACLPVTQKIGVRFYLERESSATSG